MQDQLGVYTEHKLCCLASNSYEKFLLLTLNYNLSLNS